MKPIEYYQNYGQMPRKPGIPRLKSSTPSAVEIENYSAQLEKYNVDLAEYNAQIKEYYINKNRLEDEFRLAALEESGWMKEGGEITKELEKIYSYAYSKSREDGLYAIISTLVDLYEVFA